MSDATQDDEVSLLQEQFAQSSIGRPTSFDTRFCKPAKALCQLGATDRDLAAYFNVTITTISLWRSRYKSFFNSCKLGKEASDERVQTALYNRALGYSHEDVDIKVVSCGNGMSEVVKTPIIKHYPPDTAAAFIWLKNRRGWKDKHEVEHTGENPLTMLAAEMAKALIKQRQEKAIEVKASVIEDKAQPSHE